MPTHVKASKAKTLDDLLAELEAGLVEGDAVAPWEREWETRKKLVHGGIVGATGFSGGRPNVTPRIDDFKEHSEEVVMALERIYGYLDQRQIDPVDGEDLGKLLDYIDGLSKKFKAHENLNVTPNNKQRTLLAKDLGDALNIIDKYKSVKEFAMGFDIPPEELDEENEPAKDTNLLRAYKMATGHHATVLGKHNVSPDASSRQFVTNAKKFFENPGRDANRAGRAIVQDRSKNDRAVTGNPFKFVDKQYQQDLGAMKANCYDIESKSPTTKNKIVAARLQTIFDPADPTEYRKIAVTVPGRGLDAKERVKIRLVSTALICKQAQERGVYNINVSGGTAQQAINYALIVCYERRVPVFTDPKIKQLFERPINDVEIAKVLGLEAGTDQFEAMKGKINVISSYTRELAKLKEPLTDKKTALASQESVIPYLNDKINSPSASQEEKIDMQKYLDGFGDVVKNAKEEAPVHKRTPKSPTVTKGKRGGGGGDYFGT